MKVRTWVIVGLGATLLAGGFLLWSRPPQVVVVQPTSGPIRQTIVLSGQVLPPAEIRIASLVSSVVQEVAVREGDAIEAGEVLLRLVDDEAAADLAQAKANLAAAEAGRLQVSRLSAPQAKAELRRAESQWEEARRELDREENLFRSGATPAAMLEQARSSEQVARSSREVAQLQVQAASSGGSQVRSAQASVALAHAQVRRAEVMLARHELRAPVSGVVVSRDVEPGDAVLVGAALILLSATGHTRIRVEPDERNLALLQVGQSATASAEAFPSKQFAAKLDYISPRIDPDRGTVEVHLLVPEPPPFLRQNMTASVEIIVAEKSDALLIPRLSLRKEQESYSVLKVVDGRLSDRLIELGLQGDELVEVKSGLQPADYVVLHAETELQPTQRIRPQILRQMAGKD